jgi:DNA-directed RNA polymerase subunit RPC12/RpoP
MVYCSKCGAQITDDANFCPKCGIKTPQGKAAKADYPSDELRDAFYQVGQELEKAFTIAAKETHAAFKKVNENMQEKKRSNQSGQGDTCPNCGSKNISGSIFCNSCGKRIVSESSGST